MVLQPKMRWRIESDYQAINQYLGFGDYEGRGRRGLYRHGSLAAATYGFLMVHQIRYPEAEGKENFARIEEPALPTHCKRLGSLAHAAPLSIVRHVLAAAYRRSLAQDATHVSVLPARNRKAALVTQ